MIDDADWATLIAAAKAASSNAYCPYSRFSVGAAVRAADGRVFAGCNVENASYGLTICAERNAICQAVAAGVREIVAVAVYTPTPDVTTPCGACRQVIAEFGKDAEIRCACEGRAPATFTAASLLPHGFVL
ncbi:MAG: cytidine deaminase [Candidatus Binataceae bacterium]